MKNLNFSSIELKKDFKIIWGYLKPYKKEFYKISFFALIASGISSIMPLFLGKLVDIIQVQPLDLSLVFFILFIWLLTSLFWAFLNKKVSQRGDSLGIDLSTDLICKASDHTIKLPLSFHREKKIGEFYTKIQRASDYLYSVIAHVLFWAVPQFLTAIIGILILFFIHWQLALGVLAFFVSHILITLYKTLPIITSQKKLNECFEKASGNLYDAFLNVQTIKSCTFEEFQEEKIKKDYKKDLASVFKDNEQLWNNLTFWQQIFSAISFVGLFGVAIFLLIDGHITIGGLIMFFAYFNLIRNPLGQLSYQWQSFKRGMTTIKGVEKFLKIKKESYKKTGKILKDIKGKIEFKNVSFNYEKKKGILKNISIVIQPEETIALVGESGVGKTTLVDLISLYFKPTKGDILVDNINIKDLNLKFLRENIAYVPQEITLFNDMIKNNIRFGNIKASEKEIIEASKNANAHQFIESFPDKYKQIVGERGIKLSTGQKQRIAIARALIRNPKILILDEATSSLDSESERLVQDALERLMKNRTTLIIAHRLSTIKKADKILVLEKGEIKEVGNHKELIKNKGLYFKLHSLQSWKN